MPTSVWYCTREDVKNALDIKETARNNAQVDRAIAAATDSIEGLLKRRFYPLTTTRYFDWPDRRYPTPWRLWLDQNELISVTTLTSGGTALTGFNLEPQTGPPYTRLELDRDSTASFGGGSTPQRDVAIAGVFGYSADTALAALLAEALDASETGVDVTNSAQVGVGSLLLVDSERMIVTDRTMLDTTRDIEVGGDLTASAADTLLAVTSATDLNVGEVLLVDSERMLVVDLAGNNLTVKRAWDGTVLATHAAGASLYAPRTLTVERGAVGTVAATHLLSAPVLRHLVPGLVHELAIAEAVTNLLQESSGWARVVGSGETQVEASGKGLKDLRERAIERYGRRARNKAV